MQSNSLVLEILKQESQLSMGVFEQGETVRHYSQSSVTFPEIHKLCEEVVAVLNKAHKTSRGESELINRLKKAGQLLWGQLLSRTVKEKLKATTSRDLILSLDEELIHIPWELLYDGKDFLSLKFNLGRLVRTKAQLHSPQYRSLSDKLKMLILANPTNDLKSAYSEGIFIRNQFDHKRTQINIDFKSTHIDTLYVKKNLRDYDIVHFAGHCEYAHDNPKDSGWVLSDGRFTIKDILSLSESLSLPTLVFSNACHSAQGPQSLMDAQYQKETYSIAAAFLFSGVRHYIGTIWKIEDPVSLAFAKEFYSRLIAGASLGECIRLSRLGLIKTYGIESLLWASYLLYGDPNFAFFRIKSSQASLKRKRSLRVYLRPLAEVCLGAAVIFIGVYLLLRLPTLNPNAYLLYTKAHKLFLAGKNEKAISASQDILKKDPLFLAVYPLLADAYQRMGDRQEAIRYYFEYILHAQKKGDKKKLASAYTGIAWVYQLSGEYSRAFDFYEKAVALSRENKDLLNEAAALGRLAIWYIDKEDYPRALELLTKSAEINRMRQHIPEFRYNLACDYFDIGLVFINKDDFATAKEFYQKSEELFRKMKLKHELSDCYFNLGEICLFEKEYQQALDYYLKGLSIDRTQGNLPNIASDYDMLGELYVEMGDLSKAEEFFQQGLMLAQRINASPELASLCHNLGRLYQKKGQRNKARDYLRQAQEIYYQMELPQYQNIKEELLELAREE